MLLSDVWLIPSVAFKVSSSSNEPLREPTVCLVTASVLERFPSVVETSVSAVLVWVESPTKGEVVEKETEVLDSALGLVVGVSVMVVVETAAVVGVDVSVGGDCVVVTALVVVVGAVRTEGGDGVGFRVGGGMVGVCGVNLMMEKHEQRRDRKKKQAGGEKKIRMK